MRGPTDGLRGERIFLSRRISKNPCAIHTQILDGFNSTQLEKMKSFFFVVVLLAGSRPTENRPGSQRGGRQTHFWVCLGIDFSLLLIVPSDRPTDQQSWIEPAGDDPLPRGARRRYMRACS